MAREKQHYKDVWDFLERWSTYKLFKGLWINHVLTKLVSETAIQSYRFNNTIKPDLIFVSLILLLLLVSCIFNKYDIINFKRFIIIIIISLIWYLYKIKKWFHVIRDGLCLHGQFLGSVINFYIRFLIIVIAICVFISLLDYFINENYISFELPILILLCIEGMFLLSSSLDLFTMYLAIELQSFVLYILASIKRYSNLSIEAGLKYFIMGSFASGLMLFGITLVYGGLGTTSFQQIYTLLWLHSFVPSGANNIMISTHFGLIFIICGLFFKLGVVPFHYWIADVYEGSPLIITYFFTVLPKISIFIIFIRLFSSILFTSNIMMEVSKIHIPLVMFVSCISIAVGAIGALYQVNIKRLLAYSAIVNVGHILLALCAGSKLGIFASIYYFIIYILMSINLFSILLYVRRYPLKSKLKNLVEFVSITHSNIYISVLLIISLLSMAGIPPLAGFYGKLFVYISLISNGCYLLALYAVLSSVLICVYYIRLIRFIWFVDSGVYPVNFLVYIPRIQTFFISFITYINVSFIFYQNYWMTYLYKMKFFFLIIFRAIT